MKRVIGLMPFALALVLGLIGTAGNATASSPVKVLCWNNNFPPIEPGEPGHGPADIRSAPKKCSLYRNHYGYEAAGAVHMRKLKWKHWGSRTATAKGQYAEPMDVDEPWKPIRVKLKRPIQKCGRTVYSKAKFHVPGVHGGGGFPIWTC